MKLTNYLLLFTLVYLFSVDGYSQAPDYKLFEWAIYKRNLKRVKMFAEKKNPDIIFDDMESNALFWYCYFKDKPDENMYAISDILFEKGADINRENKYNENIGDILLKRYFDEKLEYMRWKLMWFNHYNKTDLLNLYKYLIKNGLNIEKKDSENRTPLYLAAEKEDIELLNILIDANVKINAVCEKPPLKIAIANENIEIIEILLKHITNINHNTPLVTAVAKGNFEIVKILLEYNADANMADNFGKTPLMTAAARDNYDILNLLIENGASVHQTDKEIIKRTAYTYAWQNNQKKNMEILLRNGSDPDSIPYLITKEITKATNSNALEVKSFKSFPHKIFFENDFLNLFKQREVYKDGFGYPESAQTFNDLIKMRLLSEEKPDSSYSMIYNSAHSSPREILNTLNSTGYGNISAKGSKVHGEFRFMENRKKYVIDDSKDKYKKGLFIIYDKPARDFTYYKDYIWIHELRIKQTFYSDNWCGSAVISSDSTIKYTFIQNPKKGKIKFTVTENNIRKDIAEDSTIAAFEYKLAGDGYIIIDSSNIKSIYKIDATTSSNLLMYQNDYCNLSVTITDKSTEKPVITYVKLIGPFNYNPNPKHSYKFNRIKDINLSQKYNIRDTRKDGWLVETNYKSTFLGGFRFFNLKVGSYQLIVPANYDYEISRYKSEYIFDVYLKDGETLKIDIKAELDENGRIIKLEL